MLRGEVSPLSLYANNIQLLTADGYPTPWLIKIYKLRWHM